MAFLDALALRLGRRLPLVLQTEATECGLACLAMIAGYHGHHTGLMELRRRFSVSLKGISLKQLIQTAHRLGLGTRAVKLDLGDLGKLKLPCVLHWNFNHFVVLKAVDGRGAVLHDPAHGQRRLGLEEVSRSFTGVALELWPESGFEKQEAPPRIKLLGMLGKVTGLYRSLAQVLLLAGALEVFSLISPFFLQWTIDNVIVSEDRDLLSTLAIGFGLLLLMQQAVSGVRAWVMMHMSTLLGVQWQANVFSHLLRLPAQYFEKRHLGDVVSRFGAVNSIQQTLTAAFLSAVLDGLWQANVFSHLLRLPAQYFEKRHLGDVVSRFGAVNSIQQTLTAAFLSAVLDGLMTVATLGMMLLYSPPLAAIAIAAMSLYALGRWIWYRPLRNATEEQIVHAARQQSHFLETVRGIRPLKLFQRQDERRSVWLGLLVEQINAGLRTQKLQLFYQQLNGLLFGVENLLVIWLGATMVMDGQFSVGILMAFNAYKSQFDSRVGSLIDKFFELRMLQLQGERLADIVLQAPEVSHGDILPENLREREASIEIQGLRYRYAEQEPWVLDGLDLRIAGGESVAIVGPSGCGKSTLFNVLLGILPPVEGQIRMAGLDLAQLGLDGLRELVGTVLQDDVLFAGSLSDNISFFDPQPDMPWLLQCAQMAAIHDDIQAMPMGYNTLVGDMGTVLSGGQKQRVMLARALYKKPRILFLDEATSHLDVHCEQRVNAAIRALRITRIMVAHRPETIASADRVIVLGQGKVSLDESTARLAERQAAAAREQA
ncbi:peptidase domain-containing ABC transporter [Pseudomonas aeruginosa]